MTIQALLTALVATIINPSTIIKNTIEPLLEIVAESDQPKESKKIIRRFLKSLQDNMESLKKIQDKMEENLSEILIPVIQENFPKIKSRQTKIKDENAPKKTKSAYMFFCADKRVGVKEANPAMKMTDIAKELGSKWKLLSDAKKQKYTELSMTDKLRYLKEMETYDRPSDEELMRQKVNQKKRRGDNENKLKDENAPKRPKSSFIIFSAKRRPEIKAEHPEMKITEISKLIGSQWKECSDKKKEKYAALALKDKARYEDDMKGYIRPSDQELMGQKVNQKKRRESKGDKNHRKKKEAGAPKNPRSAYMFFVKATRPEFKEENNLSTTQEITRGLAAMWKDLSEEDKVLFVEQADADKLRYQTEKSVWLENKGELSSEVAEVPSPKKRSRKSKKSVSSTEEDGSELSSGSSSDDN
jgi:HMG (high mobility group) box